MELTGDARVFCIINTTEYNNDGRWCVQTCDYCGLDSLGFTIDDVVIIDQMVVGQMHDRFDYKGVIVIRIA